MLLAQLLPENVVMSYLSFFTQRLPGPFRPKKDKSPKLKVCYHDNTLVQAF